jgi:glycosyltransferase involved in cell wall biosynthesis
LSTFGITMVRNEADVIAGTLRHMADEVDMIIVADNGSTDGTADILADLDLPMVIVDDPDPAYYQSRKMSSLAASAGRAGAKWIVPFDADELWYHPLGRIRDVLHDLPDTVTTCGAMMFNHFRTALDEADPDPFRSMVWQHTHINDLPKIAFRWQEGAIIHQGNHGVTLPNPGQGEFGLNVRHFPVRSADHLIAKTRQGAAAYAATDLPADQGAHWRAWGQLLDQGGEPVMRQVFEQHYWYLSPIDQGLIRNPAPYLRWHLR